MNNPIFFNPKNTLNLFGLNNYFTFLSSLYHKKKLPKVIMLTGNKCLGKSTLVNHFLYSIFDEKNYDKKNLVQLESSIFYNQFKNSLFPNITYVSGADYTSVKIDDIRELKKKILYSSILNKERFIVFDDIELFNLNSLNALLKILEEPSKNIFFILINNKKKAILDTIRSRSLEIKIILNEEERVNIINKLIHHFKIEAVIDPKKSHLTPGYFIKFNYIIKQYDISFLNDFTENLNLLLNLYKKHKENLFFDMTFFIADFYLRDLKEKKIFRDDKIYDLKNFIFKNLNSFIIKNINQNTLISAVNNKINYE